MASEEVSGCGAIMVVALGLLLAAWWKQVLALALLVALGTGLVNLVRAQRLARLRSLTRTAERRFVGDVCRMADRFGILEAIRAEPGSAAPRLLVTVARIAEQGEELDLEREIRFLTPPADLAGLASNLGFGRWLEGQGIAMVNDLAVEAMATQAALTCLREAQWAQGSLATMAELITSAEGTLAKAAGNELLEPAIPQLEGALVSFRAEQDKLANHRKQSTEMLRKLHDFLSVPETIRPILNFDLNGLSDPARFRELERSFEEVVTLNNTFISLSRERLA
jgi:hypothetical protein